VSPTQDDLWRGVVGLHRAASIMGLSVERLVEIAERERVDRRLGFQVEDLIRLSAKLSATTRDPGQKARFRAAVSTFVAIRDKAREAAA
jgi:hypothetical protein